MHKIKIKGWKKIDKYSINCKDPFCMLVTDRISLAELLFKREFFQENPNKITRIFRENIPQVCLQEVGFLSSRVENLLTCFESIDEKMGLLQSLLLKYPKFLKISLYQLEKKGQLREILETLCSINKRELLETTLRNCEMETIELLLSANRYYVLYRILLRNDLVLIDKIPPHLFFKVLIEASVKDREMLLSLLTEERLLSWNTLYDPKLIQDTLWTFTEIAKNDLKSAPGIHSIFTRYKELFCIACLEACIKLPPLEVEQIETYFLCNYQPELLKITQKIKENNFTNDEKLLEEELPLELVVLLFKTNAFLTWMCKKTLFMERCFFRIARDPQFLDFMQSSTPYGVSLFLHLVFQHRDSLKKAFGEIDCFSFFIRTNFPLLDTKNASLEFFEGNIEPHLLENPYVLAQILKNENRIELEHPLLEKLIEQQTFCLDENILELLPPEKIRKFFSILLPKAKEVTEEQNEFMIGTGLKVSMHFSEFLTIFFIKNYFPHKNSWDQTRIIRNFLMFIPLKFFLASFARPCLRNYLVDIFEFLELKVQKMLVPLLKDYELYEICQRGTLSFIRQILHFIHPDQKDVFEEYAHLFFKRLEDLESRQTLENLDIEEEVLHKLLALTKAPSTEKKIFLFLEKIKSFREKLTSCLEECPITKDIPVNPVIILTADGYEKQVYERDALIKWVQEYSSSPATRKGVRVSDIKTYDFRKKAEYEKKSCISESSLAPYYNFPRLLTSVFISLFHEMDN